MGGEDDDVAKAESEGLSDVENTVFVAVGKNLKETKKTLFWASQNFPGKNICILHVHQPAHLFNFMNDRFSVIKVKKIAVKAWREAEGRKMHKLLNQYLVILSQLKVQASKVWIEMDNIEKGIVRVITQYNVRRLVMGAAADEHHSETLAELKSNKATFVCEQAPDSCHIWFTCKGHLVYARCGDGSFHMQHTNTLSSSTRGNDVNLPHVNVDEDLDKKEAVPSKPNSQNLVNSNQSTEEVVEESESSKETNQTQDFEKSVDRQRQELEKMKNQYNKYVEELQIINDRKPGLEIQLLNSKAIEEELEEKTIQAVNLLVTFKENRDKLQIERDDMTRNNEELRSSVDGNSLVEFIEFSFWEINEATRDFDPCLKIGDGRFGSVYKGVLRHLKVAIKMLPSHGNQTHMDFKNEARFLVIVRHPNIVTLIGTCPEPRSLIYEYLDNESLEDRLACRGKTPSLSWQTRINIASEICTALIFLHSSTPSIIHGNIKTTNILLDKNYVSKIGDMGIYSLVPNDFNNLEGSAYVAPEVVKTGEVTIESDVYSFGVVILRLLTGRPVEGVLKNVKCALEMGNFSSVLDSDAGKWPVEMATKMAKLALRCCELDVENRPDLVLDVLSEIEIMKKSCDTLDLNAKSTRRVPSHFLCPIFQEIMEDPQIAPDGFTYEGDAIKGWFNSGHKTSPMTNLKLENCDLLPNYALYYAIQEWEQQS